MRSRITFISKDGWLLSGTVRSNLDPFGEYDDYALWQVLYRVRLARPSIHDVTATSSAYIAGSSAIQDLDKDLGKEGRRLPVYERQLLCIARALLQDCTKLVIIEEAQLSPESQEIIQSVIDQEFEESVILFYFIFWLLYVLIFILCVDFNCNSLYASRRCKLR